MGDNDTIRNSVTNFLEGADEALLCVAFADNKGVNWKRG